MREHLPFLSIIGMLFGMTLMGMGTVKGNSIAATGGLVVTLAAAASLRHLVKVALDGQ